MKTSDQNEEVTGTNGLEILKFSRFFNREKCLPRVETVAGKRQTREKSGHVTLALSLFNYKLDFIK